MESASGSEETRVVDTYTADYMRDHKFTREKFIEQIQMMTKISLNLNESKRRRLNLNGIEKWTDFQLVKAHKFYWDQL